MSFLRSLFGLKSSKNNNIKVLDAAEFKAAIANKKVQLIDVRSASEFQSDAIKDAKNIDFFSGKFNVEFNKLNKEKPVYVYCRSGSRSRQTASKLSAMGFTEIYDLKGGILSYN